MKKGLLAYFILLMIASTLSAQSLSPTVLSAQSGSDRAQDMVLNWTLGEQFTETIDYTDRIYTQGFHQPYLLKFPEEVQPIENDFFDVVLSPNPVESTLNVTIQALKDQEFKLLLRNLQGMIVYQIQTDPQTTVLKIPVGTLSPGIYLLQCLDKDNKQQGIYKILKI